MTTYSISLDDVDLSLLPFPTHRYNEFLKKEHFEFQVLRTDTVDETAATIFYTCHTCAVKVPVAFASEHAASIKHRANARIASEAAQRMRALVSALPPPTEQLNARFCANCSTTVGRDHGKTKEHRVAVMHDKLLWELMTAYVGDNHDDDKSEDSDFDDTERTEKKEKRETKGVETSSSTESRIQKHLGNQGERKCDRKMENANCKKGFFDIFGKLDKYEKEERKENKKVNVTEETGSYNFKLNDNEQHHKLKLIEHNGDTFDVEIVDPNHNDNKKYDIVESNINKAANTIENGNKESNNNMIFPIAGTSKIGIGIGNNTGINKENAAPQVAKYTQTQNIIEYVEFVTEDNKLVKVQSDNYHSFIRRDNKIECIVCSSTFQCGEADSHVFSVGHLNKIPSINEHCARKINEIYSHCILCNQIIKTANLAKHVITLSHRERETQAVGNTRDKSLSQKEITYKIELKKPATLDMKLKTIVQNGNSKVNVHTKNIEDKTKQAGGSGVIKKPSKDTASVSEEKAKNIARNSEVKSISDWPVIYPYELVKDGNVRCVICDCKVPNHPDNRKGHLVGSNHAKNVAKRRLSHPNEVSTQPGVWRCAICECEMPNIPNHIRAHKCNWIDKNVEKLSHPSGESKQPGVWRCDICEFEVPDNRKSRRAHIFGNHVNNNEKVEINIEIQRALRHVRGKIFIRIYLSVYRD